MIPLARPDITEAEIASVVRVLRSPHLSLGPKLEEFESKFARYLGARHAVAVSSGTAGLHLAMLSLNIGRHDAVITTPFSFVASANCMLFVGARPVFVDIEPVTYNLDPEKIAEYIETNCTKNAVTGNLYDSGIAKRIRAILPVHVFGHPCDMDKIMQLAEKYNLEVIEDACEALGAEYRGKKIGTFGKVGVFGFYPNKQMTTGEGGMIVTDDDGIAHMCRSLRNQGRDNGSGWLAHQRLGYNYRLSDIQCALGIAQLERLEEMLARRASLAQRYNQHLRYFAGTPVTMPEVRRSWFGYIACLPTLFTQNDRDEILRSLAATEIGCSNYFPPIHLQPFYRQTYGYEPGDFPITESVSERTLALPLHPRMAMSEIDEVVNRLKIVLLERTMKAAERSHASSANGALAEKVVSAVPPPAKQNGKCHTLEKDRSTQEYQSNGIRNATVFEHP